MTPKKTLLRLFEALGFVSNGVSGAEHYGECVFCGKRDKLYVNEETGQWSCKAGNCQKEGNLYGFLQDWWQMWLDENAENPAWETLVENRGLPRQAFVDAGVIFDSDGKRYAIPVYNAKGSLVNFRLYKVNGRLIGLPTLDTYLYGGERLEDDDSHRSSTVILCEGEWDAIAMRWCLSSADESGYEVVGVPGAGVLKDEWLASFSGRDVIIAYDNDDAGRKGFGRAVKKLRQYARKLSGVNWNGKPDGYDVRDFVREGNAFVDFLELVEAVEAEKPESNEKSEAVNSSDSAFPPLEGEKPPFAEIINLYKKWFHMTPDLVDALRVMYAVVMSQKLPGDPLWMYLVSPPGGLKTGLLETLQGSENCMLVSSLSPHALVSGFRTPNGEDPSLIPKLNNKVFVLKDATEVLEMQRNVRDEIYSVLRGAYDGQVYKQFGNGVVRDYKCRFAMLAGVTPIVFAERSASLGERLLTFHIQKGVGFNSNESVLAALENSGDEATFRDELKSAARNYIDRPIDVTLLPELSEPYKIRLISLANIVAMLRGNVVKDAHSDRLLYRPQHEVPTRIVKQLKRLTESLAFLEDTPTITDDIYRIVSRVAFDSCIGFNLEIMQILTLADNPMTVQRLYEITEIPLTTLRECLDEMTLLGALDRHKTENPSGRGAPALTYGVSDFFRGHWKIGTMSDARFIPNSAFMRPAHTKQKR